jgi:hypothetical protein
MHYLAVAPMFDLRKLALWLVVLLVPGGILLLPLLIADMRRPGQRQLSAATSPDEAPSNPSGEQTPTAEGPKTPNDDPKTPPSDGRISPLAA